MVNITDPWGLWWDEFSFDTAPTLEAVTVSGNATGAGCVTAIDNATLTDAAIRDLYLGTDASGAASISLDATFTPSTFGSNTTASLVHVTIVPADADGNPVGGPSAAIRNGTYESLANGGQLEGVPLQISPTARDFLATVWMDLNSDGAVDSGEDSRKIRVHLGDASIAVDAEAESEGVMAAAAATPINFEGEGARTKVELKATFNVPVNARVPVFRVIVPNVPGLIFWESANATTPLTRADGDVINVPYPRGGYARSVWVSADPNSPNSSDLTTYKGKPLTIDLRVTGVSADKVKVEATPAQVQTPDLKLTRKTVVAPKGGTWGGFAVGFNLHLNRVPSPSLAVIQKITITLKDVTDVGNRNPKDTVPNQTVTYFELLSSLTADRLTGKGPSSQEHPDEWAVKSLAFDQGTNAIRHQYSGTWVWQSEIHVYNWADVEGVLKSVTVPWKNKGNNNSRPVSINLGSHQIVIRSGIYPFAPALDSNGNEQMSWGIIAGSTPAAVLATDTYSMTVTSDKNGKVTVPR
jgi:hypothetical protein